MKAIPTKTARVLLSRNEVESFAEQAVVAKSHEIVSNAQRECIVQLMAAVIRTLADCEGWGRKRVERFMSEMEGTFRDMDGVGFAASYTPDEQIAWVRERFGIDLEAKVKVKIGFKPRSKGG